MNLLGLTAEVPECAPVLGRASEDAGNPLGARSLDRQATIAVDTLITPERERHVTVLESSVAPGGSGGTVLYTLPSECEVCFVLEGRIEIDVEGEFFELEAGDALTFGASVPHPRRNAAPDAGARLLWILAPALPDPRMTLE